MMVEQGDCRWWAHRASPPRSQGPTRKVCHQACYGVGAQHIPRIPWLSPQVKRISSSCSPSIFLSTKSYIRAVWLIGKVIRDERCVWPEWPWRATDTLSTQLSPSDIEWLEAWLPSRCCDACESEVSFLQYTSGSTGHPKGVMVGTRNLLANIQAMKQGSDQTAAALPGDNICMVSWLPQYHDMGLIGGCLSSAVLGWRSDLMSPHTFLAKPGAWLQAISRLSQTHRAISVAPNFGYALTLRRVPATLLPSLDFRHWILAMNGAEPIRPATLRDFTVRFAPCGFDPGVWACLYGLAETCLYACGRSENVICLTVPRSRLGIGDIAMPLATSGGDSDRPLSDDWIECPGVHIRPANETGQTVRIAHPDTGAVLCEGQVGEVRLAGESVALGYWQLEDLSAATFRESLRFEEAVHPTIQDQVQSEVSATGLTAELTDVGHCKIASMEHHLAQETLAATTARGDADSRPYLRTGDLGFVWDGRLFLVGRIKDVICLKGRTLHAHDVECLAEQACPQLRPGCCAAFPLLASDGSESLGVMAELRPQAEAQTGFEAIVTEINRALVAEGIRASAISLLRPRSILKTTSGKLRRRDCRAAHEQIAAWLRRVQQEGKVIQDRPRGENEAVKHIPMDAVLHFWSELPVPADAPKTTVGAANLAMSGSPSAASLASTRNASHNELPSGGTSPDASPKYAREKELLSSEASPSMVPSDLAPPPTHHPDGRPFSEIEILAAKSRALFERVVICRFRRSFHESQLHASDAGAMRVITPSIPCGTNRASAASASFPSGAIGTSWTNATADSAGKEGLLRGWLPGGSLTDWVKLAVMVAVITAIALK